MLNTLINGRMIEAQTKSATLDDVDVKTFARFCQFAYTGDYARPSLEAAEEGTTTSELVEASNRHAGSSPDNIAQAEEDVAPPEPEPIYYSEDQWGGFGHKKRSKKLRGRETSPQKINLRQSFDNSKYPLPESQQQFRHECSPRANTSPEEDFTNVFLGHASLYVFAEKYGVESLKALTLNKMHETLSAFTLYRARIGDIVKLIGYVYSSENTPDYEDRVDELRALVTHYVACKADTIAESELFLGLLEEGGPFVRDFWRKVKERIV